MIKEVSLTRSVRCEGVTMKIECSRLLPVIVRVLNLSGRIVDAFSWQLVRGSNIAQIEGWPISQDKYYIVDIVDQEARLLERKIFALTESVSYEPI